MPHTKPTHPFGKFSPEKAKLAGPELQAHARAVHEAGGTLIGVNLDREKFERQLELYKPGCGTPTYVVGTNGGQMPCGAKLTRFGETAPYFCATCEKQLK